MAKRRKRWWANRYIAHFGNISAEVVFHRTSTGEDGWEWEIDDDAQLRTDAQGEPLPTECGRAKTLRAAKAQAERAARRHRG